MNLSIPKKYKGIAKTYFDPLGLGLGDAIFGADKGLDLSQEEAAQAKAMQDMGYATDEFVNGGAAKYSQGDALGYDELGQSQMGSITTDPRYKDAEMAALADLEDQSKNGFTARDRAEMAKIEQEANRANRGRLGAIQQNMMSRGMSGSGMDQVAQMQSAQDANEMEALKALEQEAQMGERKQRATALRGDLSSRLQNRDFDQAAKRAQAADEIAKFNDVLRNDTRIQNFNRQNNVMDANTKANYDFSKDRLGARQGQSQLGYNSAADLMNRKQIQDQQNQEANAGRGGAILGTAGGIVGGIYGGSAGASAGYQVGNGVGGQVGRNAYRNNRR